MFYAVEFLSKWLFSFIEHSVDFLWFFVCIIFQNEFRCCIWIDNVTPREILFSFESTSLEMQIMKNLNYSILCLLSDCLTPKPLLFNTFCVCVCNSLESRKKVECCFILHQEKCHVCLRSREPSLNICSIVCFYFTVGLISSKSWIAISAMPQRDISFVFYLLFTKWFLCLHANLNRFESSSALCRCAHCRGVASSQKRQIQVEFDPL